MVKGIKTKICAAATISAALVLIAMVTIPAIAASTQADYRYALDPRNWEGVDQPLGGNQLSASDGITITVSAWGLAFMRESEDTIKQYDCTTEIVVSVQPATEEGLRAVDVTGTVTVNDAVYTIDSGKAFLGKEKRMIYLNCTGTDEGGNEITLKLSGHYFWWGGKAFALRTKAIMQTDEGPMLLLQRGIAKIA